MADHPDSSGRQSSSIEDLYALGSHGRSRSGVPQKRHDAFYGDGLSEEQGRAVRALARQRERAELLAGLVAGSLDNPTCRKALKELRSRARQGQEDAFEERLRGALGGLFLSRAFHAAFPKRRERGLELLVRRSRRVKKFIQSVEQPIIITRELPSGLSDPIVRTLIGPEPPIRELRRYATELARQADAWRAVFPRQNPKHTERADTQLVRKIATFVSAQTGENCWKQLSALIRRVTGDKTRTPKSLKSLCNRK